MTLFRKKDFVWSDDSYETAVAQPTLLSSVLLTSLFVALLMLLSMAVVYWLMNITPEEFRVFDRFMQKWVPVIVPVATAVFVCSLAVVLSSILLYLFIRYVVFKKIYNWRLKKYQEIQRQQEEIKLQEFVADFQKPYQGNTSQ